VFGIEAPLTKTKGKVHEYLGMVLDFLTKGKVTVSMTEFIRSMLDELPQDMGGKAATAAANHLFEVNKTNPVKLAEKEAIIMWQNYCSSARERVQTSRQLSYARM
jgi:hypothetical protein